MAVASGAEPATQLMPRVAFADSQRASVSRPRVRVAIVGTVLVVAGAVAQLIALASATWWEASSGATHVRFGFADFGPHTSRGFAYMYFSWGAWLIAGLTLVLGLASCMRWVGAHAFRIVATVFGVAACVAPIAALLVFAYQSGSDQFHVVRDYGLGPYLAVLGTIATAIGAAAGSAR
jgi:hypothetical protein